ncbi:glycosyltransferase [aff. Roholtiella sp. LEGE 12411]|uniref:glycosyltransferase n=1 Tax=aff. Roholtiella sp. LEGE 12411 TaxID=1828822 RepID=UPI001881D519|nr:glycosyltransferase [aff. Roholtiella sp. LEGE 12411]MBE9037712.1 glycosyltransferase [aff. Roholtiella sp. LEGE 12411]
MKAIQALARYFPDKCGGIQVNLNELIPQLRTHNIDIQIAAASNGSQKEEIYKYNDIEVYRYPVFPIPKTEPNHGQFPHGKFEYFANWLTSQKADIYHQHHWEVYCGLPHLRLAKELGMATVLTVHYAIPICQRITLMFNGQQVCDGKIDVVRCSQCADTLSKKLPAAMVKSLSHLPKAILSRVPLPTSAYLPASVDNGNLGRFVRPLVVPGYVAARQHSLLKMAKYADRIVTVCDWLYKALLINGIPEEKLILSRHGISYTAQEKLPHRKQQSDALKVVFLGRWDIYKGIDILVQAVKNLSAEIPIELVIHGITQDERYRQKILNLIANEPRIRVDKQLTREELPQALANYDLLAVPSQCLETGPLVVLEAQSLSVPVIGSNLGGIAELVRHGIDGWLVTANDTLAWTKALELLATDTNLLNKLRQGIKPVRTVNMQAADLATIYNNI